MPVARGISEAMQAGSWIRRMFERGRDLKARLGPDAVFDLSLGNPLLEPPAAFRKALAEIAKEPPGGWHRYMTNAGFPEVREAVALHLGRKGLLRTTRDHIVMCCGAGGGLNVALKTLLDPGDEVIVLAPYFPEYLYYVANHGGRGVVAQTDAAFLPDLAEIARHLTPRTKAILLNSPNNPTGRIYPHALLQALADLLERHGRSCGRPVTILSDEPYREIVYGSGTAPSIATLYPHTLQVYSWSKSLSVPGERIGYIAVNPETPEAGSLVDGLVFSTRVLGFINAPATMQRAAARLLDVSVDLLPYRAKRDRIVAALQTAGYDLVIPEAAFYVFPKSPIPDDVAFCEKALEEMVLVVPGCGFGRAGHFRLAYCTDDRTIDEGLKRLAKVAEKLRAIRQTA
jgi:aspartate aminotransferase